MGLIKRTKSENKVVIVFLLVLFLFFNLKTKVSAGETIDILDFFISKHAIGESDNPQSLGYTEYVSGSSVYVVKSPSAYEYYTWDNNFLYIKQDTSVGNYQIGGGIANSYRIIPGLWMKRFMQVGERIDSPSQVDWFDRTCKVIKHWDFWPYFTYLESHKKYNAGGNLGVQEVIVLQYNYGSGYEKFYYSKEWGWIRWEEWDSATETMKRFVDFNTFKPAMNVKTSCGTPMPDVKTPTPTSIVKKPGDTNGDGLVNGIDYVVWLNNYNKYTGNGPSAGDFNKSGRVDGGDYVIWLNNQ